MSETKTTDQSMDKILAPLAEARAEIVYADADAGDRGEVDALIAQIDMADTNSIIFFGAKAQQGLTGIADQMLEGVKNKDVGPAGGALSEMVATLRGFDIEGLARKPSWLARLFGAAKPLVKFLQGYEEVRGQIDKIATGLEKHKHRLLIDIESLDRLYDANLDYFHNLALYIAAGGEKLRQLDDEAIPALAKQAEESGEMLDAQNLRDLRAARDDLERRVHDLKLTRQVTMQSLPSIRLVQENDKGLVTKINSTIANTIPLWKNQLAQAITIYRSGQAAGTLRDATDLTNELLESNAKNLRTANREVRQQLERGIFDVEKVKAANDELIATINESLEIAEEGRRKRAEAEGQLAGMEEELRKTLASAASREAKPAQENAD